MENRENKYTARELYKMSHEDGVKYMSLQDKPISIYTNESSFITNPDSVIEGTFEEVNTTENTDANDERNIYIEYIKKETLIIPELYHPTPILYLI